ncbi:histone H3.3-like [Anoplophora glabripennis]|uniref:histone H3.3-like n=1 Tax=Anoplophora glabripennis TaxID=217634 RepID=UPI00087416CC|nr:histone H3.3-like [Anoplophora glabripennis]
MVKRKSIPKKAPQSPGKRRKTQTQMYQIGTKNFKVNSTTLRSIKKLQTTTTLCIPRLPFSRLIREIIMDLYRIDHRIERQALVALQEAAEMYLTYLFEDANRCAHHARRVTLLPKDMRLVLEIKGCSDPGYNY